MLCPPGDIYRPGPSRFPGQCGEKDEMNDCGEGALGLPGDVAFLGPPCDPGKFCSIKNSLTLWYIRRGLLYNIIQLNTAFHFGIIWAQFTAAYS